MEIRALVLRVIPFSDKMQIIKCLTDTAGLQSYSVTISRKSASSALTQTGNFIQFTISSKAQKLPRVKDPHLDPAMNQIRAMPQHLPVWFFALELLSKSAAEGLHIPGLREAIDRYYTLLCSDHISKSPLIPLLSLAAILGTEDLEKISAPASIAADLKRFNFHINVDDDVDIEDLFNVLLRRFKDHFNIFNLDALSILS